MANICIECKDRPAQHWRSHFCEECFREILQDKVQKEDERKNDK
ncbi:hypothetical protein ACLM5H_15685 [Fredinandcohnia humi]